MRRMTRYERGRTVAFVMYFVFFWARLQAGS